MQVGRNPTTLFGVLWSTRIQVFELIIFISLLPFPGLRRVPCLQSDPDFHYSHLARGIRDSVIEDPSCLGAETLSKMTGDSPRDFCCLILGLLLSFI